MLPLQGCYDEGGYYGRGYGYGYGYRRIPTPSLGTAIATTRIIGTLRDNAYHPVGASVTGGITIVTSGASIIGVIAGTTAIDWATRQSLALSWLTMSISERRRRSHFHARARIRVA